MGCGSSISTSSSIKTKTKSKIPLEKEKKSSENIEIRRINLEPLTLVSLHSQINKNDRQIRSIIDFIVEFDDENQCEEYLVDPQLNSLIFLILPPGNYSSFISRIHHFNKIHSIYLFNSQTKSRRSIQTFSKVKETFEDRDEFLQQLSDDVDLALNFSDFIPVTVYSRLDAIQTKGNSIDHLRFLFYQIFFHQFCLNSSSNLNENDFCHLIRRYYSTNRRLMKLIDEFQDEYRSNSNVFRWFSNESFLRRILIESIQKCRMSTLFSLRFFIRDMFKSMINEDETNLSTRRFSSTRFFNGRSTINEQIVFRAQLLSKETFLKMKSSVGEIVSLNNFFFAQRSRSNCLTSLRRLTSSTDSTHRVLFEMKIPSEFSLQKRRPFIEFKSANSSNENEILFFLGSIFRINNVDFDLNNDLWIIQLTLYDETTNEDFSQMFRFLFQTRRTSNENLKILTNLLRQISPRSAEEFYRFLSVENENSLSKIECFQGLGLCSYSQENYSDALNFFEKSLQIKSNDDALKSSLHHNLGLVYAQLNQMDKALEHFRQALDLSSIPLHRACVHHNMALVHSQQGQYQDELDHYEKALKIREEKCPNQHLQLASLHNNIGVAYSDLRQYDRALSSLRLALQIRVKHLPEDHLDVARSYANIGTVYVKTNEFSMASDYFTKAKNLFEKRIPPPEFDLEQLYRNIKILNDKNRRKTR